jgi:hypothetical protein
MALAQLVMGRPSLSVSLATIQRNITQTIQLVSVNVLLTGAISRIQPSVHNVKHPAINAMDSHQAVAQNVIQQINTGIQTHVLMIVLLIMMPIISPLLIPVINVAPIAINVRVRQVQSVLLAFLILNYI